jgi:mono/diheme cytochrome c family protein
MKSSAGKMSCLLMSTTAVALIGLAAMMVVGARVASAQEAKKAAPAQNSTAASGVARGQYIVEGVAMCGTCHTPRLPDGQLDRSRWLAGASDPYLPAHPIANWPTITPRIGGLTPTSDEAMVKLLTTGIWTDGKQLRDPMPKFHMNRADAEAVVAYLKSLTTNH